MSDELVMRLSEFVEIMKSWENQKIGSEQDLFTELRKVMPKIVEALAQEKEEIIDAPQ